MVCNDNNPCNGIESCIPETGVCNGGTPIIYDDGDPCNGLETCDPETGLERQGTPLVCEDNDPCTINECGTYGCISYPSAEPGCCNTDSDCDDNDPCNGIETCEVSTGVCQTGPPLECVDGDACTFDNVCIPGQGCVFAEKCYDQDPCTVDSCNAETGECTFSPRCDDGINCTLDTCDEETGACQNELVTTAHPLCDDNNKCTIDVCDVGSDTCTNTAVDCSARDACEHDGICNAATGQCQWEPIDCYAELDVDPNDKCVQVNCSLYQTQMVPEGCYTTAAILNNPSNLHQGFCDDDNPCTNDGCDSATGCTNTPYDTTPTGACDDNNACTNDGCGLNAECENTPIDLSDNDACTIDTCNPNDGIITHTPKVCSDQNTCSFSGCDDGTCTFIYPDRNSGECCDGKFFNYSNAFSQDSDLSNYIFCHGNGGDTQWHRTTNWSSSSGGALYFGNATTFNFINTSDSEQSVSGAFITEPILLPNDEVVQLEFDTIMGFGTVPFIGNFEVALTTNLTVDCGAEFTPVWTAPENHQLGIGFNTVSVDLSAYAGQSVSLRFSLETLDHDTNNGVGLLIDDILVTSNCPADPCGADTDCDDGRLCTIDTCGSDNSCVFTPVLCDDGEVCTNSYCDGFTGECVHEEVVCEWDNDCINAYCGDDGQCVYDIVQIADDDLCNGHEYCNIATGEHDSTDPVTCDWVSPCWGGNTCNPNTGQCERGDPIDCNAVLNITPDDDKDGDSSDNDGSACHGEAYCQLSTGECIADVGHPLPLDTNYSCPNAPEKCDDRPFQTGLGDAPSGYFKATDASGFFLKDQDIWVSHQNIIDEIYATEGVGHPSAAFAVGNSNRQAVGSGAWVAGRPLCLEQGFSFDWDDFSTIRGWWPQGVSGTGDAYTSGELNGKEYLAVSSYHKAAEDDYNSAPPGSLSTGNSDDCAPGLEDPDIDRCTKGARISFFDLSDGDDVEYRHMLLATPVYDEDGNASLKRVASHAGGIVWYRNWLYVPQTGSGFRVFDMNQIIELPFDKDSNFIGVNDDGQISAFNYRYVIPEVGRYYLCPTCCCSRFSFVSLITDNN